MKRKFIITEINIYEVEAETAKRAMDAFLRTNDMEEYFMNADQREVTAASPSTVRVGDQVNVDAHGLHGEDFSGVVTAIGQLIEVKAPDGETYNCDPDYVYVPEPSPAAL